VVGGVVLGREADQVAGGEAEHDRHAEPDRRSDLVDVTEDPQRTGDTGDGRDDHRDVGAEVQLAGERLAGTAADEERADDRGEHADRADEQREQERRLLQGVEVRRDGLRREVDATEQQRGEHHRCDDRTGVGLEEVGAHAGDVADVVADVVGDGRRVARVVLGDPGLDLADEVRTDVSGLRVDAATDTGEQGDRRAAETEGGDDLEGVVDTQDLDEEQVGERDAEQPEAGDGEAHDRATAVGERQRLLRALARGLRGAHVGCGRDAHADEAGDAAEGTRRG
jgi:hypothetical protein